MGQPETTPLIPQSHRPALKVRNNFLQNLAEPFRSYVELIRLEKPTGTILMFWPFAWGLTMAGFSTGLPFGKYCVGLALCLFAAFIVRSSACTINDIFDRKLDAGVERTKNRPLASGRLSVLSASLYLAVQYTIGINFFYFTLTGIAFAIYPLLKRVTFFPQAWLGLCMNFGFVTARIAVTGNLHFPLLLVSMIGLWCWTMVYDTIYACQDIKDDVKVGVRSTAILFGNWIRPLLIACAATFVAMLTIAGYLNGHGIVYFVISVAGTACFLAWQFFKTDLEVPASCWWNFNSHAVLGCVVWIGMLLDYSSNTPQFVGL
ncbi:UbiA prenyltransferase family-domain-containing protein [Mycena floridula]|nr:UbiA prenyltransferase family-domain-containing protein [Mycena floridula]